jgi:uncharacterized protein (TIGR04255 family)
MTERSRPSFRRPPVNEVVCSVTFRPLASFQVTHYGLFWEQIRQEYPQSRTVAPLGDPGVPIEVQPGTAITVPVQVQVNAPEYPRVWLISPDETCLVQLQPDRLLFNWRQRKEGQPYPRYTTVSQKFRDIFFRFQKFAAEQGLGSITVRNAELAYVNIIKRGTGWSDLSQLGSVFPDLSWRTQSRFLPVPDAVAFQSKHAMDGGTLNLSLQTATSKSAGEQAIRFDLSAQSGLYDLQGDNLFSWFEKANVWIVDGFIDVTSEMMQREVWERER